MSPAKPAFADKNFDESFGFRTRDQTPRIDFQDLFADVEKELRRMEELFKEFELEEPKLEDLKRPWKRGGGVSIRITSGTGKEPKVEIETFGDLKRALEEARQPDPAGPTSLAFGLLAAGAGLLAIAWFLQR